MTTCPLCGNHFDEEDSGACVACPLNRNCGTICCPNCGYQFIERSWLVDRWRAFKHTLTSGRSGRGSKADNA